MEKEMKTSDEVRISKIEVKMGDQKVSLTPEQAKKLHAALNEMFGDRSRVTREYVYTYPWWHYTYTNAVGSVWSNGIGNGTITTANAPVTYTANSSTLTLSV